MRPRITVYLTEAQLEYLRRGAARRRRSLSSYVTDCLVDYHVDATQSSQSFEQVSPPFSALLRDTEEKLVSEIDHRISRASSRFSKELMVLSAMLDRFVLSALVNTPEVPEANRARAISSGERRYRNWREAVTELLDQIGAPRPVAWRESTNAPATEENAA